MVLASRSPPTSSKVIVDLIFVSTRPVRSPYFSPSLAKTSSRRRWRAHSRLSRAGFIPLQRPRRRGSLVEHAVLDEDWHAGAEGERDRVGRACIQRQIAGRRLQMKRG